MLVAHSSEAVIEQLTRVIEADPRLAVVATAQLGEDAIRKAAISWPTVVVMDLAFNDMGAGRMIRQLSQARLPLAVLIVSESAVKGSPQLNQAVQAGAYDFTLLPKDPAQIERIGRQIVTSIFVASFSKTKMIPQVDPAVEVKTEAALAQHARLNAVVLDCASNQVAALHWLLPRVHPQSEPAVIAVLREPTPAAAKLIEELGPRLHAQAIPYYDGVPLQSGRIVVLDAVKEDRTLELDARGRPILKSGWFEDSSRAVSGPSPIPLYRSLGKHYGGSLAVVMCGKPSPDSAEGLMVAKEHGALTIAFEQSVDLLDDISRRFPKAACPDDILTLDQIDRFMNAVLITQKA